VQIQEIASPNDHGALTAQSIDRLEGAQVVAELSFGVAEFAFGQFVGELKCLLEGHRVPLDLNACQSVLYASPGADLLDPVVTKANGLQEARRILDRLDLALNLRNETVSRFERHSGPKKQKREYRLRTGAGRSTAGR
jgi:hypothetical protein